jgi:hypothetical protein
MEVWMSRECSSGCEHAGETIALVAGAIHPCQMDPHCSLSRAFMLTFEKGSDNFYANVGHLNAAENG